MPMHYMKKYFFPFAALLLLQTGCAPGKKAVTGLWVYYAGEIMDQPEAEGITSASFIDLHSDGTYTKDLGNFDYGKWQQKDSILILTGTKKGPVNYVIKSMVDDELDLRILRKVTITFVKRSGGFDSAAHNPFSVQNNQWRIPAGHKESDQQIKERLRNHCRFYQAYFQWGLDDNLSTLDVRGTASAIKIYKNGFVLVPFEQLGERWKSYFYDEEDCRKANDILKDIFERKAIVWENKEHSYKMFLSAFRQLEQMLK